MANEIQRLFLNGASAFGSYRIHNNTASTFVFSSDEFSIQLAMDVLWDFGNTDVTDNMDGTLDIEFIGSLANTDVELMTVSDFSGVGDAPHFENPGPQAPPTPARFFPVRVTHNSITLSWDDTGSETGYRIERRLEGTGSYVELDDLAADTTSYEDDTVSAETAYDYRLIAYNAEGDSSPASLLDISTTASGVMHLYQAGDGDAGNIQGSTVNDFLFACGKNDATAVRAFARFLNGPPQGSVIDSALLKVTAFSTGSKETHVTLACEDADDAAKITVAADGNGRSTTSGTAWDNVPAWTSGNAVTFPDIKDEVQAVVDRTGYTGTIQVIVDDNGSSASSGIARQAYTRTTGPGSATALNIPRLEITYTGGDPPTSATSNLTLLGVG